MPIRTNNWDVETYRNAVENNAMLLLFMFLAVFNSLIINIVYVLYGYPVLCVMFVILSSCVNKYPVSQLVSQCQRVYNVGLGS